MNDYEYENICASCGKPFLTTDEDENYCFNCWREAMIFEYKGKDN